MYNEHEKILIEENKKMLIALLRTVITLNADKKKNFIEKYPAEGLVLFSLVVVDVIREYHTSKNVVGKMDTA